MSRTLRTLPAQILSQVGPFTPSTGADALRPPGSVTAPHPPRPRVLPLTSALATAWGHLHTRRAAQSPSPGMCLIQLRSHKAVLCLLVPSHTEKEPCHGLVMFFTLLGSLLVVSLFKMVLGRNAEALASVPGPKKAEMCLTHKVPCVR